MLLSGTQPFPAHSCDTSPQFSFIFLLEDIHHPLQLLCHRIWNQRLIDANWLSKMVFSRLWPLLVHGLLPEHEIKVVPILPRQLEGIEL
ncbi:hypothetical protein LINPERHAP2_LOCUS37212 [Linum perenne]